MACWPECVIILFHVKCLIRWQFVLRAKGTCNKTWMRFQRFCAKLVFEAKRQRAAEWREPLGQLWTLVVSLLISTESFCPRWHCRPMVWPLDLRDLWRRVKKPHGRQRCHIQGRRKPHQDIRKARERWPKLHAEGHFMTRKWNPSVVRRDEVHREEASTFPSSKSWQGKVCIFHPAHVSRVQRAKTFSIFHLIILLPRIYPLIAHTQPHAPALETRSHGCALLQMCIVHLCHAGIFVKYMRSH